MKIKKGLALILTLFLVTGIFTGCSASSKHFSSEEEMYDDITQDLWVEVNGSAVDTGRYECYWFQDGFCVQMRFSQEEVQNLEDSFEAGLEKIYDAGDVQPFSDFSEFLASVIFENPAYLKNMPGNYSYLFYNNYNVDLENNIIEPNGKTINFEDGIIETDSFLNINIGEMTFKYKFEFKNNDTVEVENLNGAMNEPKYEPYCTCERQSFEENAVSQAFNQANQSVQENQKEKFLNNYDDLPKNQDVQYDPYSYIGDNFSLRGSADLDDYYNFNYLNFEVNYFCVQVTPQGGSILDAWYVYANRNDFPDLYNTLRSGNISAITMICNAQFAEAASNNMATLVDYFIG